MQNLMVVVILFVLDWKYPSKKSKFGTSINLNMHNSMAMFTFSIFDRKYLFFGEFGPKNETCQFKLKFGIQTNSNMQNSVVLLTFSALDQKHFLGKFVSKNQNCQFKLKFGIQTHLNEQNSMVMFTFSVLDQKHSFQANLFQKIKIVSLS